MDLPEVFTVYGTPTGSELYSGPANGLIWALRSHAHNLRRLGVISQEEYMGVLATGLNPLRHGGSFSAEYENMLQIEVVREDLF